MATHDYVIDNSTGANVRADINSVLQAILTNNSSSSAPSTTAAYMFWADTTSGTLKIRNSSDNAWVELLQLDGTLTMEDGSASTPGLAFRNDLNTGLARGGADILNLIAGGDARLKLGATTIFNESGADVDFRIEGDTDANLFYVDAGNDRIGIGTASPTPNKFHVVHSDYQVARFENTNADANGTYIEMFANSSSPADNDVLGLLSFRGNNSAAENTLYATIRSLATDVTDGTEDGAITFQTRVNGTMDERVRIDSSGKLGIGTTSPAELLHLQSTAGNTKLRLTQSGSTTDALNGAIHFGNSTDGQLCEIRGYTSGSNNSGYLELRTTNSGSDVTAMTINTAGDVGIGAGTPRQKLHIGGSDSGSVNMVFTNSTTGNSAGDGFIVGITGGEDAQLNMQESANLKFSTADTERMRIDSSGRLLVGTTSSRNVGGSTTNSKLQIEGASQNASSISLTCHENDPKGAFVFFGKTRGGSGGSATIVQNGDTLGGLSFIGADSVDTNNRTAEITAVVNGTPANNTIPTDLVFSTSTANANQLAERMRIDSSGNVGIGLNNPSVRFTCVAGSDNSDVAIFTGGDFTRGLKISTAASGNNDALVIFDAQNADNGAFSFKTHGDERMRIDSSGRVGIGTTSPSAPLTVSGTIFQTNTSTSITNSILHLRNTVSSGQFRVRFDTNNNIVGSISVGTSSTAYNTSSDYRLKENITAISDGITRLKTLKPSRFNWITEPNTTVDGFLAHEVTAVPEAIEGTKDAVITQEMFDAGETEGEVGDPIYQQIDQSKLVPLLTAALQEAVAKLEVLETKVAALEAA